MLAALGALALLSGCGSGLRGADADDAHADVDAVEHPSCASTALQALGAVATRVYREGISSERTISARRMIETSSALRSAVEHGDAAAASAAGRALIATGHMTNLRVVRGKRVLVELGGGALAPLKGTLNDAAGKPLASYVTSVWADGGLIAEVNGIAEAQTVLRSAGRLGSERDVAGATLLPAGALPAQGTLTREGVAYEFTSLPVAAYPAGAPQRVYVLRTIASTAPLCGASDEETTFNTISRIAHLIYDGEAGKRTVKQIRRVQANAPLLRAVAKRDPAATRAAIAALLHQHIVRLRVSAHDGRLLSDVGGPYVLAPVTAPLRSRRAHDRQLRHVDPGRRGLQAPGQPAGRAGRAHVHGLEARQEHARPLAGRDPGERQGDACAAGAIARTRSPPGVPVGAAAHHRADPDALLLSAGRAARRPRCTAAHGCAGRRPPALRILVRSARSGNERLPGL